MSPACLVLGLLLACSGPGAPSDSAPPPDGGDNGEPSADGGGTQDGGGVKDGGGTEDGGGTADGGGTEDGGGTADGGGTEDGGSESVVITGEASAADNEHNQFSAIVTVTVDQDSTVRVDYGEGELDHSTPEVEATAGEPVEILVLGLRASRSYQLQAVATQGDSTWESELLSYRSQSLPLAWPVCTPSFTADETDFDPDEVVCTQGTSSDGRNFYYCTDYWGEPVYVAETDANDSLMSMRPMPDGSWVSTSYTSSKLIFIDRQGATTASYTAGYFDADTRFEHEFIDSHEAMVFTEGDWAGAVGFYTNAYEWFPNGTYKLGNGLIVFEPDSREVLYDYSFHGELGDYVAMDEKMPYSRAGNGDYAQDWNHANTIVHGADDDGREYLLLSLKSQDWIFKLYPDTDELAWALGYDGDFTLVEDMDADEPVAADPLDWGYHQHGVRFVDAGDARMHLLMLDNGYPRHDGTDYRWDLYYSRILELRVDEERMMADTAFAWGAESWTEPDWFFSTTCGNAELLKDGSRVLTLDGEAATRIEVSYPEGVERWRMSCETIQWCEYRVSWFPNLYETTWIYE